MRSLLAAGTAVLLLVATLAVVALLREPGLHQSDAAPVIYPGREPRVMALVAPLLTTGFVGRHVTDIAIDRDTLRLALNTAPCGSQQLSITYHPFDSEVPATRGDPAVGGAAQRGLGLRWSLCDEHAGSTEAARVALNALVARWQPGVWGHAGDPLPGAPERIGMLTPVAWALHLPGRWIVVLTFAITLVLTALLSSRRDPVPPAPLPHEPRSRVTVGALAALALVGGALRVHAAITLPIDGDEPWGLASPHGILADDHDARAHPPLYRAVQSLWTHAIPHADLAHPARLRGPSLGFALLALVFVAAACAHAGTPSVLLVGTLGFALAAAPMVLARPYGLAVLLVTLAAVARWTPSRAADQGTEGWRWGVALAAFALAAWTDLFAGLGAAAVLAAPVLARSVRRTMAWPVAGIALLAVLPLLPGAWHAARADVHPVAAAHADVQAAPDLRPTVSPVRFARDLLAFELTGSTSRSLGAVLLVGALVALGVVMARAREARADLLPLFTVLAVNVLLVIAASRIGLRERNVAFVSPLAALAWASFSARRGEA